MHTGSCHCGAVAFRVEGEPAQVIECNCSHCSRKGLLLWFVGRDALHVDRGQDALTEYRFNRRVIAHQFCSTCGVQPFAYGTGPDGRETAAINVRCLDDVEPASLERIAYDGRSK